MKEINRYLNNFKNFMNLEEFPKFKIIKTKNTLKKAKNRGIGALVSCNYDYSEKIHLLKVEQLMPLVNAEHLFFHEFTHIIDIEKYAKNSETVRVQNLGYSEYHAGQIELLNLLGMKNLNEIDDFILDKVVLTKYGSKKAIDYTIDKINTSIELIGEEYFPQDLQSYASVLGLIFNFWGMRSIFEMYSNEYQEIFDSIDYSNIKKFLGGKMYILFDEIMHGWLEDTDIEQAGILYMHLLNDNIKKYNL